MKLDKAIEMFLVEQEVKGNTKKTRQNYRVFLGYFQKYCDEDIDVKDIDIDMLNEYSISLRKSKCTTVTIQTYIRHLRSFIGWLESEGYITSGLHNKFKLPKAETKVIEILSDEEINIIFKQYNEKSSLGLRNILIIALMLDCGLRKNEVVTLCCDNIHITQGVIKVKGKGQKERIVPIGVYTKRYLIKYLNGGRMLPELQSDRLLIDKYRKPITDNAIKMMFQRLKKKTGIERLKPHLLRHTFATRYLLNGGDTFSLQQILGHTTLVMVRRYVHLASSYTVGSFKIYSPLDNYFRQKQNINIRLDCR